MALKVKSSKKRSLNSLRRESNMFDVKKIRKDFPMFNNQSASKLTFLDNASTTFKPQSVIDEINLYYSTYTANSHRGDYDTCFKVDQKIDEVRNKVAKFINADVNEVVFTLFDISSHI